MFLKDLTGHGGCQPQSHALKCVKRVVKLSLLVRNTAQTPTRSGAHSLAMYNVHIYRKYTHTHTHIPERRQMKLYDWFCRFFLLASSPLNCRDISSLANLSFRQLWGCDGQGHTVQLNDYHAGGWCLPEEAKGVAKGWNLLNPVASSSGHTISSHVRRGLGFRYVELYFVDLLYRPRFSILGLYCFAFLV